MHRSRLLPIVLALVVLLSAPGVLTAGARQATPSAAGTSLPFAPDPALCQVVPRPAADYQALVGTDPAPTPVVFREPPGTPADQAIVDAVTATVVELVACQNVGENLRAGALYTDDGLAEDFFWIDPRTIAYYADPFGPPAEEDWLIVHSVSQVEVLADGRVGARLERGEGGRYGPDYLIFAEENGRYLIDHFVDELLVTAAGEPDGMRQVSIGDRALAIECRGEGSPTVILEAGGFGTPSGIWSDILPEIAEQTRVCRYERANNDSGLSDPAPRPRTGADVVADLHDLLEAADEPGPYVLVGRSLSGIFVRLYAAAYPDDVVGMVLVDTTHEAEQDILEPVLTPEELEVSNQLNFEGVEDPEGFWTPEGLDALFAEMREARAAPFPPIPLVVLAAGQTENLTEYGFPARVQALWWPIARALQADLATLTPDARLIVAEESGHFIDQDQPQVVIDAIGDVVDAVRDPGTWEGVVATSAN